MAEVSWADARINESFVLKAILVCSAHWIQSHKIGGLSF